MNPETIRRDFDEIARIADGRASGMDRYDPFLLSLVPETAADVLEIGCGLGRLSLALATGSRRVTGIDLSPEMIARAARGGEPGVTFICEDFLSWDAEEERFDCVLSAAALHHMPADVAVPRMIRLLRPGGRLIIHDVRADAGMVDRFRSLAALGHTTALRLLKTGRLLSPRPVREAWKRHGATESYLTIAEAARMAARLLPGEWRLYDHWLWRYTLVWDRPAAA